MEPLIYIARALQLMELSLHLTHSPACRYLIFHLARFTKNNFYVEKNPTIVNFPVKNLELRDCEQLARVVGYGGQVV